MWHMLHPSMRVNRRPYFIYDNSLPRTSVQCLPIVIALHYRARSSKYANRNLINTLVLFLLHLFIAVAGFAIFSLFASIFTPNWNTTSAFRTSALGFCVANVPFSSIHDMANAKHSVRAEDNLDGNKKNTDLLWHAICLFLVSGATFLHSSFSSNNKHFLLPRTQLPARALASFVRRRAAHPISMLVRAIFMADRRRHAAG